jgi:tungstate transport system substrate-binding protein
MRNLITRIGLLALVVMAGCGTQPAAQAPTAAPAPTLAPQPDEPPAAPQTLRLATTTSTADSGLLDAILPAFEQAHKARVEVIAVGSGQALELGKNGDVDVVLVHARAREDEFVAQGFGVNRRDVMYNDFVIVGPPADPASISAATSATEAFTAIMTAEAPFASRGDDSGTFSKEQSVWAATGFTPTAELGWYKSLGQGMGETLVAANELGAYTLTDRGTFLSTRENVPDLTILFGGATIADNPDQALYNPYGVIPVNPERHAGIQADLAEAFAAWIVSLPTQQAIARFGQDEYGQPLFYAVAAS